MIPILYRGDEQSFSSNGIGRLADCTRCIVVEERNGIYECEFDYPVSGAMFPLIREGCVVGVTHDDAHDIQPFDIYGHSAPLDGVVTFYCRHISYRLSHVLLRPYTADSCPEALQGMETHTYNPNPFSFWTDKAVSGTWKNDVPASCRAMLAGQRGSILDVYGEGEYEFDKWMVRLHLNRGVDNGVAIRYGVNLTDLKQDTDHSDVHSAVAPYWKSEADDTVVTLPEGYIVGGTMPLTQHPWTNETDDEMTQESGTVIEFTVPQVIAVPLDLSREFPEPPSVEELRARARSLLESSEAWLPNENLTVRFADLAHTTDYRAVAALQRVRLCDRVSVYCGPLGVKAASMRVIRVIYNTLTDSYDEIELGSARANYGDTLMTQVNSAIREASEDMATQSMLEQAVGNVTEQITGARDSRLRFIYNADGQLTEIVIMDTDRIDTARKVWRWNSGGLGFSSNGYGGPYTTAITQDGAIVADFITTGTLTANLIRGGTLTLGDPGNTRGVLLIRDAEGNVIGRWDKDGISASNGTFGGTLNAADGTFAGTLSAECITSGTLSADRIGSGTITSSKLASDVNVSISEAQSAADSAVSAAAAAQAAADGASSREQTIYRSAISGTVSMAAPTGWVTSSSNSQDIWTTTRPVYDSAYPVLFVAVQRMSMAGALTCTTPVVDQTTTVIDGGHITTGAIDAGRVTAGTMSAARIKGGTLTLGGLGNENGLLQILDDTGTVIGVWDKDGINATRLVATNNIRVEGDSGSVIIIPFIRGSWTKLSEMGLNLKVNRGEDLFHYVSCGPIYTSSAHSGYVHHDFAITDAEYHNDYSNIISITCSQIQGARDRATYMTLASNWINHTGNLVISGTKSRRVQTDQYADRLLYCYETPSPMFGDVGEGIIGKDGLCYIPLDPVFAQTVTTARYQVFVQAYGEGQCRVRERYGSHFIVAGTPGLSFAWEVKARQKDYDQKRLEGAEPEFEAPVQPFGKQAVEHIRAIQSERVT